jgi:hypothetical protein
MLAERARTGALLKRLPTLDEVANFAAFVASDRAGAMTGAIANSTCGSIVDERAADEVGVRSQVPETLGSGSWGPSQPQAAETLGSASSYFRAVRF